MKKIWNFFEGKIKRIIKILKRLTSLHASSDVIYKVIDINPEKLLTVIKCINTLTKVTDTIPRIIKDKEILAGLAPIDACWLGYYYGDAVQKKSAAEVQHLVSDVNFLMRNKRGRYQIHSFIHTSRLAARP